MENFNATILALTDGLRELPGDDATRVKNFLAEYLGSPQHPVPFGGRGRDFDLLDTWLADRHAPPYTLLAAPAGRGKSALLLRWCQRLLAASKLAVVYFPVSIRFRTNLASSVFPALVALLARLHGEPLPDDPHTPEEVWRGLLLEYMTRPLPDGRLLVIVLDGVDEAADWEASTDLFPLNPPPNLRVVLSARYLANDQDASAWLKRLGWTRPGLARSLELYPLDRAGIAGVLTQMGFPLDLLGSRVDIVSELHRLSEGDPLLIRLYVDDLWKRGPAVMQLRPEDLHAISPGLVGYFEHWWNDQRLLWNRDAPQREKTVQYVLNLLAGALGPLERRDILHLASDEPGLNAGNLAQHLEPLARFVIGDGIHQGYVFSHPRLANYFLEERLSLQQRQEVEQRFLAWGKRTLLALNKGSLAPAQASAYIVQYYGAHLERAGEDTNSLLALVSDGWRCAWEKLDRANAGFLGDSERARRAAERANAAATGANQPAPYLGAELRSLLCHVSINSMTSNVSPQLMLEAVKTGVWTPAQGLASLRLITDIVPRVRELVGLASFVPEPLRTDILQEALDTLATLKDERARLDALVELAPGLSEGLLGQVLESLPAIEDEADRAGMLVDLASVFSAYPALVELAWEIAQGIEEEEYFALALAGLVSSFKAERLAFATVHVRSMQDERYRAQALMALIPYLPEVLLQVCLEEADRLWDNLAQARLLVRLADYLPEALQSEARQSVLRLMHEIFDQTYRVELFVALAPGLPTDQLALALQEIEALWDESERARALGTLIPYLPAEQLVQALALVRTIKHEEERTVALRQMLPLLPQTLLERALEIVEATWDEGLQVELLATIASIASTGLLPRLLEIIPTIKDTGYRVWLLAELEASGVDISSSISPNLAQTFQAMRDPEQRLQTLLAIVARLSDAALTKIFAFMLPEIFNFRLSIQSAGDQAHTLSKLGPRLPATWLPRVMSTLQTMTSELCQAQVLIVLAPRLQGALLTQALDIVRAMQRREIRAQVLEALVVSLPEERKAERVREMLQVLQIIKDENEYTHAFFAFAATLETPFAAKQMPVLLETIAAIHDEIHRMRVISALAPHLPEGAFQEVLQIVQRMQNEEERVLALEALTPYVPGGDFAMFLAAVQSIRHERWQIQVLEKVIASLPREHFASMLRMVQNMPDSEQQARALRALASHTPEDAFARLWSVIQRIKDPGRRAWVLGGLNLRVPDEFFPQLWASIQTVENEGWQLRVLAALAPHMSESFFAHLWTAVQEIKDERRRMRVFSILARFVPERFFPDVFFAVQNLMDSPVMRDEDLHIQALGGERVNALLALAERVPESFFSQFWQAVSVMPEPRLRAELQLLLILRTPESFFPLIWDFVSTIRNDQLHTKLLMRLAERVPESFFPQFWQAVQELELPVQQALVLKVMIPHLSQQRLTEILNSLSSLLSLYKYTEILEEMIPYLSERQSSDVLELLFPSQLQNEHLAKMETKQRRPWLRRLAALAVRLSEQQFLALLPTLLQQIQQVPGGEERGALLAKLAPRVPEEALPEVLEMLWSISPQQSQAPVLTALLMPLAPGGWAKVFELATAKAAKTGQYHYLGQVLQLAGVLSQASSRAQPILPGLLYPALRTLLHTLAQCTRRQALAELVPLAAAMRAIGGDAAARDICCTLLEMGYWWP